MRGTLLVARRELSAYLRSLLGYIVAAGALLGEGLWFQGKGLGAGPKLSSDVLLQFFDASAFTMMVAAVILSMRLLAGEREHGTLVLLRTAPIRDSEIVAGKFLAALALLALMAAASIYMPLLIFVNGKVSTGHILVGYLGVLLLGAASLAIGLFASALAPNQVIAAIAGAVILLTLGSLFLVARVSEPPLNDFLFALNIYPQRQRPFLNGVLRLENVLFYVAVAYFFLLAATHTLRARRWR
jgi:ABC-2 type transport system permease protein